MENKNNSTLVIIIAIIAVLLLVWFAVTKMQHSDVDMVNNTDSEMDDNSMLIDETDTQENEVEGTTSSSTASETAGRLKARADLIALQTRLIAKEDYGEAADDVKKIQEDLKKSYASASVETRAQYDEMSAELKNLETALRDKASNVLDLLKNAIAGFGADVKANVEAGD